jgi:hypothetical protein
METSLVERKKNYVTKYNRPINTYKLKNNKYLHIITIDIQQYLMFIGPCIIAIVEE